jgi:hypothetical protein
MKYSELPVGSLFRYTMSDGQISPVYEKFDDPWMAFINATPTPLSSHADHDFEVFPVTPEEAAADARRWRFLEGQWKAKGRPWWTWAPPPPEEWEFWEGEDEHPAPEEELP